MPCPPPRSSSGSSTPCSSRTAASSSTIRCAASEKPCVSKMCEPMWQCSPTSSSDGSGEHPADRLGRGAGGQREAELLVLLAGLDVLVGVRLDAGRDPDVDALADPGPLGDGREPGDLLGGVDDDACRRRPSTARVELGDRLVVAVEPQPLRREAGRAARPRARRRCRRRARAPPRRPTARRPWTGTPCRRSYVPVGQPSKAVAPGAAARPEVVLVEHQPGVPNSAARSRTSKPPSSSAPSTAAVGAARRRVEVAAAAAQVRSHPLRGA